MTFCGRPVKVVVSDAMKQCFAFCGEYESLRDSNHVRETHTFALVVTAVEETKGVIQVPIYDYWKAMENEDDEFELWLWRLCSSPDFGSLSSNGHLCQLAGA